MAKKYDIKLRTGEYTDNNGETKGRYLIAGVIFETKTGNLMGKLNVIPTGDWDGTFFLSEFENNKPQEIDKEEIPF